MTEKMTPKELLETIIKIADDKKAVDTVAINVHQNTTLTDYFIIMTGTSSTHIKALSDIIEERLKKEHEILPHHIEGVTSNWILMDYTSVVVNIFTEDTRELFALERMWADGTPVNIDNLLSQN